MTSITIPHCGEFTAETERDLLNADKVCQLIAQNEQAFSRERLEGHITASAFVIDPETRSLLMTHHAKLGKWYQLGGHCDGIKDAFFCAKKEAYEESGLLSIRSPFPAIFDIDIHPIPARKLEPEHWHFDIRYVFLASSKEALRLSEESLSLKWVGLDAVQDYTLDDSILLPLRKLDGFLTGRSL
jgi:8-oxo-dGTP pyrophosphatase MutT (NUDIX family)